MGLDRVCCPAGVSMADRTIRSNVIGICFALGLLGAITVIISEKPPAWHVLPYLMTGLVIGGLLGACLASACKFFEALKHPTTENRAFACGVTFGIACGVYGFATEEIGEILSLESLIVSVVACAFASFVIGGAYGMLAVMATRLYKAVASRIKNLFC